jgi:hypothetical protein
MGMAGLRRRWLIETDPLEEICSKRKHVQLNLLGQPLPDVCPFCGFPFLKDKPESYRCEYWLRRELPDFSPFKVIWHVDLEEEEKRNQEWASKLSRILSEIFEALKRDPEFQAYCEKNRLQAWVESRKVKFRRTVPQVSLISYLIPRNTVSEGHR